MKHLLYILALSLLFYACSYTGEFRPVETNNTFDISFPDYMKVANDLKPDAELQYSSPYRNTYAIVEKVEKNGQSLTEFQQSSVAVIKNFELLENPLVTDSIVEQTESYTAIHVQLYGEMEEENIYYWHSSYETNDYFYELAIWTRSMDRKQRYGDDITKIIESFTPLQ